MKNGFHHIRRKITARYFVFLQDNYITFDCLFYVNTQHQVHFRRDQQLIGEVKKQMHDDFRDKIIEDYLMEA